MDRLTRAIAIRPGESRSVMLVAGAFAAVEAGRGLGEVGVDTLVLTGPGVDILPPLFIGLGLVGMVATLAYGTALSRSTSERFFPTLLVILAVILATGWLLTLSGIEAAIPVVYVSVYAAGLLLLTAMWTVGGFAFDARQAKRLFPLLTSAAIVGSLAGSLSAIVVQRLAGAELLILAEALLFLVAAILLGALGSRVRPRRAVGAGAPTLRMALSSGASYVAASPLMRLMAIAYVLLAILMFSLTFGFMGAMQDAFPTPSELLPRLAILSAAVTALSFLAGTLLANRLFARFGIATVALALPVVYLLGFGLWMVRFTLLTAVVFRITQQVTQRGLSNAAFSSLYNVIPSYRRGQVLAFMDGVPGQAGTMISGALLILAASLATEQIFLMGLATAAACVVVLILVRRAYASSLVATLRDGHAERVLEGGPGLEAMGRDATILAELRGATRSPRSAERLFAADLLGRIHAAVAVSDLRRLCTDEQAGVRAAALTALGRIQDQDSSDLLDAALNDADPAVRAASLLAMREIDTPHQMDPEVRARLEHDSSPTVRCELAVSMARWGELDRVQTMLHDMARSADPADRAAALDAMSRIGHGIDATTATTATSDPSPLVRAAALRATAALGLGSSVTYVAALDDDALAVRSTAATILRNDRGAQPLLVQALQDGSPRTQEGALSALDGNSDGVEADLLVWAESEVVRATELRGYAMAFSEAGDSTVAAYLGSVVTRREGAIEHRLLQTLAVLGVPEAGGLIRRCLRTPDPETRAQAIEALDSLGDARLSRGVVRLLDRDVSLDGQGVSSIIGAATTLSTDHDPWVRALALRTLSEQQPAPLDSRTFAQGESAMPGSVQLVSDIDRMLILRRVPIFGSLEPEDLQRVVAAAVEQGWLEGEVVMAEGDVSDELVVIVEGGVRVLHRDGDRDHEVRTYAEGDHIGELALLREAPRAATVIAGPLGMRGLVIDGAAIGALLRERPEAAMAMLATLAERISQQA